MATIQGGGTVTAISIKSAHAWEEEGSTLHEEIWALPPSLPPKSPSQWETFGRPRTPPTPAIISHHRMQLPTPANGQETGLCQLRWEGDAEKAKKGRKTNLKIPPFIKRCRCVATCLRNTFRFPTASCADPSIRAVSVRPPFREPQQKPDLNCGRKVFVTSRD